MRPSTAILGAGAMGSIIARGLLRAGWEPPSISVADKMPEAVENLATATGVQCAASAPEAVAGRSVVVIAVKPNNVTELLDEIRPALAADQLVISIAAGVPIAVFEQALPGIPIVRAMPNTPAAVEEGMTAYATGTAAGDEQAAIAQEVLGSIGKALRVTEEQLDAVTAVSGSGPAYVFLLAEAMTDAGMRLGLDAATATTLVNQTLRGAGMMLGISDKDAAGLRVQVTSPGGTTAAALGVFEDGGLRNLVDDALQAAAARSIQLGEAAASDS
ncbi:MAG: pyrroline-5-carboxylate reductase [Acidimicrobiia bacterium]|nr:pyrroline-5-carboxylate reductase [Acidimicrobiia bacterium]